MSLQNMQILLIIFPQSKASLLLSQWIICHIAVPALPTYTHSVKDKSIMTNKNNMYMQDDAEGVLRMNGICSFVIQGTGTLPQSGLTSLPLL